MDVEVPRRAAAWHGAAMMIAGEHLLAQPRRHCGRRGLGRLRTERADDPGIAFRALDHLRRDIDLAPGAVLRGAPAIRALLVRDLMRRALGASPRRDHRATQRLDELGVETLCR